MKILLVTTSFEDCHRSNRVQENSHYPLGIAYLHSYLEKFGHQIETLFLNDYQYSDCHDRVVESLNRFQPDFVGFNLLTPNRTTTFRMIEFLHENSSCQILVGGIHATVMHEQILLKYPYIIAVVGEGEETTRELIEALTARTPWS